MKRLIAIFAILPALAMARSGQPEGGFVVINDPTLKEWPYSIAGACDAIHDDTASAITLGKKERLQDALERLKAVSPKGGVIEIPQVIECDLLKVSEKHYFSEGLTLRGIGRPKAYCRSSQERHKLGGTIPKEKVSPYFLMVGGAHHNVLIENIEVDGYNSAIKFGDRGNYVIRNSWLHHGPGDGVVSSNTGGPNKDPYRDIEESSRFSLEVCGSEVSHYGQGNHKHNFYIHRSLGGWPKEGFDTWSKFTLVDNYIHSPGWASAVKSTANENRFYNNSIISNIGGGEKFHAQMLIDVPSCSVNTIIGNLLHNFKPTKNAGGSALVGLRNRRTAMRGCEIPLLWYPYTNEASPIPIAKDPSHPAHTEKWWSEQNGKIWFPTILKNNRFFVSGEYAARQTAIEIFGTYPVYEGPKKVSCFLPTPDTWYERSRLYSEGNTFIGFTEGKIYKTTLRRHHKNCVNQPQPSGTGPSLDMYEVVQ